MADGPLTTTPGLRQMIEDLSAIARVPDESIRHVSQQLEHDSGFLTDAKLRSLVSEAIEDESCAAAAFNALQNVPPGAVEQVLESIQRWRRADRENLRSFPDDVYAALEQKLPMLISAHPALNRTWKAKRLRTMLGNELQGAAFICDARPVYNKSRDQIEGMIALTTMKLVYERQDLAIEELEIIVTVKQLEDLIGEAQKAQKKLATLRDAIAGWIPNGFLDGQE